jgi:hypothetical protein
MANSKIMLLVAQDQVKEEEFKKCNLNNKGTLSKIDIFNHKYLLEVLLNKALRQVINLEFKRMEDRCLSKIQNL